MNATFCVTKDYENTPAFGLQENKPNQTQFQSPAKPPKEREEKNRSGRLLIDPKRSKGPPGYGGLRPDELDLHAVIDYAKKRGIGIILYVNRRALERQLDEILPL